MNLCENMSWSQVEENVVLIYNYNIITIINTIIKHIILDSIVRNEIFRVR